MKVREVNLSLASNQSFTSKHTFSITLPFVQLVMVT